MKNRNLVVHCSVRCGTSLATAAAIAMLLSCAVETGGDVSVVTVDEDVYEPGSAADDSAAERPGCHPDITYGVGDSAITVPGYCAARRFEQPTIGDPDPTVWDGVPEIDNGL